MYASYNIELYVNGDFFWYIHLLFFKKNSYWKKVERDSKFHEVRSLHHMGSFHIFGQTFFFLTTFLLKA